MAYLLWPMVRPIRLCAWTLHRETVWLDLKVCRSKWEQKLCSVDVVALGHCWRFNDK